MFLYVIFCLDLLFTQMTRILILCDYPCGKGVSYNRYKCKVPDSADWSIKQISGSSVIRCEALGRPAWHFHTLKYNNGTQVFFL